MKQEEKKELFYYCASCKKDFPKGSQDKFCSVKCKKKYRWNNFIGIILDIFRGW